MVRHAAASDQQVLLDMYREIRTSDIPGMTWSDEYPTDEEIQNDLVRNALYVLEEDGELIGAVAAEEDEVKEMVSCDTDARSCEISRVAVVKRLHGKGKGSVLLSETLHVLKQEGYEVIRLLVSPGNQPACRLYTRSGFQILGEADKYGVHWLCCEKWI